ncbi:VaFE repeat-containing surface-anchored protein [Candidatus Saccharibacteria bacterium]|nr:VaFE repeat-containing surface-anchored protein [Candidatus Saccharibacteria bacterium]
MFHLSSKMKVFRLSIIIAVIVSIISAAILFIVNRLQDSHAITPDGTQVRIYIKDNTPVIKYYGHQTRWYQVSVNGQVFDAYCAEPTGGDPTGSDPDTDKAHPIASSDANNAIKLLTYIRANNNAATQSLRDQVFSDINIYEWGHDDSSQNLSLEMKEYAFTHAVIGVLYQNQNDRTGLNSTASAKVDSAISQLRAAISNNSRAWQVAANNQMYYVDGAWVNKYGNWEYEQDIVWQESNQILGSISFQKRDSQTGATPQPGLSFAGITVKVYNNSNREVYNPSNGQFYAQGAEMASGTTNAEGKITFNNLPALNVTYSVKETASNSSYQLNPTAASATLTQNGQVVEVSISNEPNLGKIVVTKVDSETGTCMPNGNASLVGTKFELINNTGQTITYNGQTYANGAKVAEKTIQSTSSSACSVSFEDLPRGTYIVRETASGGYAAATTSKDVNLNADSVTVSFTNTSVKGKITVNKTDADTGTCTPQGNATFNNTKFEITNDSDNAVYYGGRQIARGSVMDTKTLTSGACSATFENLPYGKYIVKEIAVGEGYNRDTTTKTITIPTNNNVNITTSFANPAIKGKVTVNKIDADTGSCTNSGALSFAGVKFTITNNSASSVYYGGSMKAKNEVIATKTMAEGDCSVTFENLPYGSYIIKETNSSEGYQLNTTPQTITIPTNSNINISTTFANQPIRGDVKFIKMDATNNKVMRDVLFSISALDKNENIKETHIVVSNNDGVVNTSASFIPHTNHTNGYDALYDEVDPISFSGFGTWFGLDKNGNAIPAKDSVGALPYGKYIIQELRCGSNLFCTGVLNQKVTITINSHNQVIDLGDWNNACTFFSLDTTATDAKDGDHYIEVDKEVEIVDLIDYCVKPNTDFTLKGVLMDKATGEPFLVNGEPVENSMKLRSETDCGQTKMSFKINAEDLGGKDLVVFETLYYKDDIITKHDDIDDDSQTVTFIKLATLATNDATGEKLLPLNADVTIKDHITYCLKPDVEYTIKSVLMNKNTGTGLLINSEPVEIETTLIPAEACGEKDIYFHINTADLGGADLVIFESLYEDEELILEHRDFNNYDETVSVAPPAPDTGFMTRLVADGGNTKVIFMIAGGIILVGVGGYYASRHFARKKFMKKF